MTDTPETDHLQNNLGNSAHPILSSFCRKLERERDEAQRKVAELQAGLDDIEEYGTEEINAAVDLRHQLAVALCERDEAREQRDRLLEQQEQWRLSSVCRELVEQRDRLAAALWSMLNQDHGSAIRAGILLRSLGLQYLNQPTEP